MTSYETEHNIPAAPKPANPPRYQRPDLSTFWTNYQQVDTSNVSNAHATPIPADMSAVFRNGAELYQRMLLDRGALGEGGGGGVSGGLGEEALEQMVQTLVAQAEQPPRTVEGVGREFVDSLDRVPKKSLEAKDECPICGNAFLSDPHPLVVRLPCHPAHKFDLECIEPWLKLQATCPLDRKELVKKKLVVPPEQIAKEEEEDGEWDDMYA